METHFTIAFGLVLTATLIAMACLLATSALTSARTRRAGSVFSGAFFSGSDHGGAETVFLFDDRVLLDASPAARAMIAARLEGGGPWFRAIAALDPMFPGLRARLDSLPQEGRFTLPARAGLSPQLTLQGELAGGITRLTLHDGTSEAAMRGDLDHTIEISLREELGQLRDTALRAPMPVWRENSAGEIIWANNAYLAAATQQLSPDAELVWPLPRIFDTADDRMVFVHGRSASGLRQAAATAAQTPPEHPATASGKSGAADLPIRAKLQFGDKVQWFDIVICQPAPGTDATAGRLCYALPADGLVAAETGLREFTQTLAKTFAQLPIGLAIFDHARVLQMFNPALLDLTGLPVEHLLSRPTLAAMLDTMREQKTLPEPKDYRSWRRQIVEMESAAASGFFEDTWTLPSGQTFHVTGRPHPNGALAFMIEDISTEVTRTRRYRADLEQGQAVIDGLLDAVVVLSQDGSVAMANAAAIRLWGEDPVSFTLGPAGGGSAIWHWRQKTAPTLLWTDLEEFVGLFGPRDPWDGELRLTDGRPLSCRVSPMPNGSTMVIFRLSPMREGAADRALGQAMLLA